MTTLSTPIPTDKTTRKPVTSNPPKSLPGPMVDFAPWPEWGNRFEKAFGQAIEKYLAGSRGPEAVFTPSHERFFASLGSTSQEIYDFVEDWCEYGQPSFGMAFRVTEVRAEYFLLEQYLERSSKVINSDSIPSGHAALGGFVWLPRIIPKARAKLRGELPIDMMFGCAGDRVFLKKVGIDPAKFLRVVWAHGDDDEGILEYVQISAEYQKSLR